MPSKPRSESAESQLAVSRDQLDADRAAFEQDRADCQRRMRQLAQAEQDAEAELARITEEDGSLRRNQQELEHHRQELLKREAELEQAAEDLESSRAAMECRADGKPRAKRNRKPAV